MVSNPDSFVAAFAEIRWFHAIGQPLLDEGVVRLASCSEWPGPEDPRVEVYFTKQQDFKDELEALLGGRRSELVAIWDAIHRRVLEIAGPVIGYDPAEDAWHGPSTATWHAASSAGLIAWCQAIEYPVPDWLAQQWAWFKKGRWPAGFASLDKNGKGIGCLVL